MEQNKNDQLKRAVLELEGATCMSCVYTIEHLGRKMNGIDDVYVDVGTHKIFVEYRGSDDVISEIASIVRRLGYTATPREIKSA
jgi:copper chaperone CopZ